MKNFYNIEKEIAKKYDSIYTELIKLYPCKRCGNCCCRKVHGHTVIYSEERNHLISKYPGIQGNIIRNTDVQSGIGLAEWLIMQPCKFYHDEKCMIYNDRPITCRYYPFSTLPTKQDYIEIENCPHIQMKVKADLHQFMRATNIRGCIVKNPNSPYTFFSLIDNLPKLLNTKRQPEIVLSIKSIYTKSMS